MFFVNFAVPFYVLVARDAKRNSTLLIGAGMLIFITHFIDVYLLVIPGVVGEKHFADGGGFMWWEWAMFIGFHWILCTCCLEITDESEIGSYQPSIDGGK